MGGMHCPFGPSLVTPVASTNVSGNEKRPNDRNSNSGGKTCARGGLGFAGVPIKKSSPSAFTISDVARPENRFVARTPSRSISAHAHRHTIANEYRPIDPVGRVTIALCWHGEMRLRRFVSRVIWREFRQNYFCFCGGRTQVRILSRWGASEWMARDVTNQNVNSARKLFVLATRCSARRPQPADIFGGDGGKFIVTCCYTIFGGLGGQNGFLTSCVVPTTTKHVFLNFGAGEIARLPLPWLRGWCSQAVRLSVRWFANAATILKFCAVRIDGLPHFQHFRQSHATQTQTSRHPSRTITVAGSNPSKSPKRSTHRIAVKRAVGFLCAVERGTLVTPALVGAVVFVIVIVQFAVFD